MRILVTGSNGMLGSDLVRELVSDYDVCGLGRRPNPCQPIQYFQADLASRSAVLKAISSSKPAIIVHAAAYTDVDGCELNPYQAFLVNVGGTQSVAEASDEVGATLFFISSDYVFDGTKPAPYEEEDQPNPLSVYGRSKFEAEEFLKSHCRSAWIIRSSWLFGANGRNFFRSLLQKMGRAEPLRVVDDQKGTPTYTKDLAKVIRILIERGNRIEKYRIYHVTNEGVTTWFRAAKKMIEKTRSNIDLSAISSRDLKRPAKRPQNSVLNLSRLKQEFGLQLRSWEDAFEDFWSETLEKEWHASVRMQQN